LESVYNVNVLLANFRFSFRIKQILIWKILNIKFDVYESESQYYVKGKEWVKKLVERGIAHKL
jgi:arginyl-tRNA synthetase